nr:uncharacterized protein LOC113807142 [Penaeus vannamei]
MEDATLRTPHSTLALSQGETTFREYLPGRLPVRPSRPEPVVGFDDLVDVSRGAASRGVLSFVCKVKGQEKALKRELGCPVGCGAPHLQLNPVGKNSSLPFSVVPGCVGLPLGFCSVMPYRGGSPTRGCAGDTSSASLTKGDWKQVSCLVRGAVSGEPSTPPAAPASRGKEGDECRPWQRKGRTLERDETYDYVCPENRNGFFCATCKTLVQCIDGKAYPEQCRSGDFCDLRLEFGGAVCYPNHPVNCTCQEANTFSVDLYSQEDFFFCGKANEDPEMRQCPRGEIFDEGISSCRNRYYLPACTSTGVFANPANCTQFYTCFYNINGWVQSSHSCNNSTHSGLMYNEQTAQCEDPCQWRNLAFTCQKEGRFPDPFDCRRYFECVLEADGSAFRQVHHTCPEEYTWHPSRLDGFGLCVEAEANTACAAVLPVSKCAVPEDRCGGGSFRKSRTKVVGENGTAETQARIQDLRITIKVLHPDEPCPLAFKKVFKQCIHISADMLPWAEARTACRYFGGDLATPTDVNELKEYINTKSDAKYLWVGGTDADDEAAGGGCRVVPSTPPIGSPGNPTEADSRTASCCLPPARPRSMTTSAPRPSITCASEICYYRWNILLQVDYTITDEIIYRNIPTSKIYHYNAAVKGARPNPYDNGEVISVKMKTKPKSLEGEVVVLGTRVGRQIGREGVALRADKPSDSAGMQIWYWGCEVDLTIFFNKGNSFQNSTGTVRKLKYKDSLGCRFKQIHQRDLLALEISMNPVQLFRMSTGIYNLSDGFCHHNNPAAFKNILLTYSVTRMGKKKFIDLQLQATNVQHKYDHYLQISNLACRCIRTTIKMLPKNNSSGSVLELQKITGHIKIREQVNSHTAMRLISKSNTWL